MEIFLPLLFILLGILLLIKGADWLVGAASEIARKFQISDMVIGLTIVAFGTSLPELVVSLMAAFNGSAEIAVGNVTGSNIANILLILGTAGLFTQIPVARKTLWYEIPFSAFIVLVFMAIAHWPFGGAFDIQQISRIEGGILMFFFALFMGYTYSLTKDEASEPNTQANNKSNLVLASLIVLGILALVLGGKLVVDNAVKLAQMAGWSERFIGLSIIAIGTSLPELATTVVAAYRKQANIAIGNVVGSNIFNVLWIIGITALVSPINLSNGVMQDLLFVFISTMLLFIVLLFTKPSRIVKPWAAVFLILYFGYLTFLYFYQ